MWNENIDNSFRNKLPHNRTYNLIQRDNEYSNFSSKNISATDLKTYDNSKIKISSEFRKILKMKLTRNSDKIIANLRKLKQTGSFSKKNNLLLDNETLRNTSLSSRSNPDIIEDSEKSYSKSKF